MKYRCVKCGGLGAIRNNQPRSHNPRPCQACDGSGSATPGDGLKAVKKDE